MSRINDRYLDCIVYVYPSIEAAKAGHREGGTGFLIAVPEPAPPKILPGKLAELGVLPFLYAVTNNHVVFGCDTPVIRINTRDGGFDTIATDKSEWTPHPDYADVAIYPIEVKLERHKFSFVSTRDFVTKERVQQLDIGPGDEVFFTGRFVTHEGRARNLPTARFGNIAMMPLEAVANPASGIDQESFLVEARSVSGYSGSPVFVYIPPMVTRPASPAMEGTFYGPYLLGIDWGHLGGKDLVRDRQGHAVDDGLHIRQNAAMMTVVPAWKLQELVDLEELAEQRRAEVARLVSEVEAREANEIPD